MGEAGMKVRKNKLNELLRVCGFRHCGQDRQGLNPEGDIQWGTDLVDLANHGHESVPS